LPVRAEQSILKTEKFMPEITQAGLDVLFYSICFGLAMILLSGGGGGGRRAKLLSH
jgi:hypothetical protein